MDVRKWESLSHVQIFVTPKDWRLQFSSVHGISQARILEQVATSFSKGSSWPRNQTHISCVSCIGRRVLYHWGTLTCKVGVSTFPALEDCKNSSENTNIDEKTLQTKMQRVPETTVRFDNFLEGLTELKSCYPHSYSWLQEKDTDQSQLKEKSHRAEPLCHLLLGLCVWHCAEHRHPGTWWCLKL